MRSSPRGVYTILTTLLVALPLTAAPQANGVTLSIDPGMVKGPASAAVTIVEFADYQ